MRSEAIEAAGTDGRLLRVEFTWLNDRFGHLISAVHQTGDVIPLLESIEGTPADNWPPSPPLQSLSLETLPDGRRVALLVGMAGGSHWSASIEPTPGRAEFTFDLACRHTKEPTWLGSSYHRMSELTDTAAIICDEKSVATQEGIAIKPRSASDRGTTRWKFAIRLGRP